MSDILMIDVKELLKSNKNWSEEISKSSPDFFQKLSTQQKPKYLWIGCSDSRVPANEIVNLLPGEMFVHRNVANVVVHTDLNCLSVIQYAVEVLDIKDIIVCGHYGCGGVEASLECKYHGLIDNWLRHIEDVSVKHEDQLAGLSGQKKINRLCELNVIEQVNNVARTTVIQQAWRKGMDLKIHGWIYGLDNGRLKDLKVTTSGLSS